MESRPLYVLMNFRGLEHSAVCIFCVDGADGIVTGANLGLEYYRFMEDSRGR